MRKFFKFEVNHTLKDSKLKYTIPIAFFTALILTFALYSGVFSQINMSISDKMYQKTKTTNGEIVIIGIDEVALDYFGPTPWKRDIMAEAVNILNSSEDCRPSVIGIDMMYFGYTDEDCDNALAKSAGEYDNVVTASFITFEDDISMDENGNSYLDKSAVKMLEIPFDELNQNAKSGHINIAGSSDGIIRHSLHYVDMPDEILDETGISRVESFPSVIYKKYMEHNGLENVANPPLVSNNSWYIPYSAKSGGYSDGYSVADLFTGEISPEIFSDKIVLIGPYTSGLLDNHKTSIDSAEDTFGTEIHANTIEALIRNEYQVFVNPIFGQIILFLTLFLLFFPFYYSGIGLSTTLMTVVVGGYILIARNLVFPPFEDMFLFNLDGSNVRYMLDVLYLPLGVLFMYLCTLILNLITAHKQKKQITDTFKKYVDPSIINELFQTGIDNLELGGKTSEICVMFVDIRGFTSMSEILSPREIVTMLGEYLEMTSSAIFKFKGTLDKFIGDATMAFWNAPIPQEDYIYNCVLAAWDLTKQGLSAAENLKEKYGRSIEFGIGINCGEAVVGNIGTPKRLDYTAIGNTVNIAARLESNAKAGQILISEKVYDAVKDRITAVNIGERYFKGKSEAVTVYAVEMINEYVGTDSPLESAKNA